MKTTVIEHELTTVKHELGKVYLHGDDYYYLVVKDVERNVFRTVSLKSNVIMIHEFKTLGEMDDERSEDFEVDAELIIRK